MIINANIEPSFYEKILWSSDYQEWKDYGIQTTFDDRYKIAIIFISLFTILLFVFKLKENSDFNNLSTLFQSKNFLNYHVFLIIFILTTFFSCSFGKIFKFSSTTSHIYTYRSVSSIINAMYLLQISVLIY